MRRATGPVRSIRLAARLAAGLLLAWVALVQVGVGSAAAHPLSTTAVLLDLGPGEVTGRIQLPIDRLAIALDQPLTATTVAEPARREQLRRYVLAHTAASDPARGAWRVGVTGGQVQRIDGVDHLVFQLSLRPPAGPVGDFRLDYDAILHHLLSHRIFVAARTGSSGDYSTVGVLDWQQHTIAIPALGAGAQDGFLASARLGIQHIADGADHLLFLVMLLLPAPLTARAGRWVLSRDGLRGDGRRVVHVVTCFAIGHSITLAAAALGYLQVPTRIVESGIAASILVSGLHAVRPLLPRGEAWIALGFGLMHGLAFAALIARLGLGRRSLLADLLGFNLGIELAQLIVVALLMPSLLLLSRTRAYPATRLALAGGGIVLAAAWLAERTTLIGRDPLEPVTDGLISHPLAVAAALALLAVAAWAVPRPGRTALVPGAGRPLPGAVRRRPVPDRP